MAKRVKFNIPCLVAGAKYAVGDEETINDNDYSELSLMNRLGVPYVELVEDHKKETVIEQAEKAPKPKRKAKAKAKAKRETATKE